MLVFFIDKDEKTLWKIIWQGIKTEIINTTLTSVLYSDFSIVIK